MSAAGAGTIRLSVEGGLGTIVIDNPAKRNALSRAMCLELIEAVGVLERTPAVKVIALTGVGQDFSAGVDISELREVLFDLGHPEAPFDHLTAADIALSSASKPTFALVQGICMGGAWQLASACDVILASNDSRLAITPAKLGIVYPRRGVERLVRMIGPDRAKYLLFTGDEVPAEVAERWGLFTEVIPTAEYQRRTAEVLQTVAQRSQYAIHTMKALIDAPAPKAASTPTLSADWQRAWLESMHGQDFGIGQSAFLAGRQPQFTWVPS